MIPLGTLRARYGRRRRDEPPFGWAIARLRARVRVHHGRRAAENLGALVGGLVVVQLSPPYPRSTVYVDARDLTRRPDSLSASFSAGLESKP